MTELNVVTGGLSYIGKYITKRLVSEGKQVVVLTGHPHRPNPFGSQITIAPWNFDNESALIKNLQGATTLYNTYWVCEGSGRGSTSLFSASRVW